MLKNILLLDTAPPIRDVQMDRLTQLFNLPAVLGMMLPPGWMLPTDNRSSRREGVALMAGYAVCLAFLLVLTPRGGRL